MKKEWFVIRSDHHEGPYSVNELDRLFSKRKIEKSSNVWKEGLNAPISFGKFLDSFVNARSGNYESQFVKTKVKYVEEKVEKTPKSPKVKKVKKEKKEKEGKVVKSEPEVETETIEETPVEVKESNESESITEVSSHYSEETDTKDSEHGPSLINKVFSKMVFMTMLTIGVTITYAMVRVGVEYYEINNAVFDKPKLMKRSDYKRMITSLFNDKKSNFSVSKDSAIIWMAFNSVYDSKLDIQIKSDRDSNLNLREIIITGSGQFLNKLASFKRLRFEGSDKIVPGVYDIEIKNITNDFNGYWLGSFFNLSKIKKLKFEKIYLGNMKQAFFENKLKREKLKKSKFHQNFMLEIEQRRKTLKAILAQIEEEIRDVLANSGKKKARRLMRDFKTKYIKTYGYFFSMFVKENQEFFNKVVQTTFDNKEQIISGFNNLAKIAKSSAQNCSEIMEMFKGNRKLSIKQTIRLEKEILGKFRVYQKNL